MNKSEKEENFDVIIASEKPEDNTVILTTSEMGKQWLETAMRNYDAENKMYSAYLNDLASGTPIINKEVLDGLAVNPQNDLNKVKKINEIVRIYVNKDLLIPMSILNTGYHIKILYRIKISFRNLMSVKR